MGVTPGQQRMRKQHLIDDVLRVLNTKEKISKDVLTERLGYPVNKSTMGCILHELVTSRQIVSERRGIFAYYSLADTEGAGWKALDAAISRFLVSPA